MRFSQRDLLVAVSSIAIAIACWTAFENIGGSTTADLRSGLRQIKEEEDATAQRLAKDEAANAQLQSDWRAVTDRLAATETEQRRPRIQAKLVPEVEAAQIDEMPQFPLPPPKWTLRSSLPTSLITHGSETTLGAAFNQLVRALNRGHMSQWTVYAIGKDGFALVCRLEHIMDDGTPEPGDERWSSEPGTLDKFTLRQVLHALFLAEPGRYRIIALTVTPQLIISGNDEPDEFRMIGLSNSGAGELPDEIRDITWSTDTKFEALIYEFYRPSKNDPPQLVEVSRLTPIQHLVGAGFWKEGELQR